MQGIERRAKNQIHLFTLMHPEHYQSLENYQSKDVSYRQLMKQLLPEGWNFSQQNGIWGMVKPGSVPLPSAGFKLHLSATADNALALLSTVVPIFIRESVPFKFLIDEHILNYCNSHLWQRESCGKFITVYPENLQHFKKLAELLCAQTLHFVGPYILSDQRYQDNHVLYYRYGAFTSKLTVNIYGEKTPLARAPDGALISDARLPYFALPDGIEEPFPSEEEAPGSEILLKGRYRALASLSASSKGGVYKCIDLETGREVVVKEARPFITRGANSTCDAVEYLENEYRVLQHLRKTGVVPLPVDFFREWEHSFLVMDFVPGHSLFTYTASGKLSIILMTEPSASDVASYCESFLSVAKLLLAGLQAIHQEGIVLQDISPANILYDDEQGKVTFVDLESAQPAESDGSPPIPLLHTPGFSTPRRLHERPTAADDYRSLGNILANFLYPIAPFFTLAPDHRERVFSHLAKEKGIPEPLLRLIIELGHGPSSTQDLLQQAEHSLGSIRAVTHFPPLRNDRDLQAIVDGIAGYIVGLLRDGDPLNLPTDYRRFNTNPLSISYGMSGIAFFLNRVQGEVPGVLLDLMLREVAKMDHDSYAPGLYIGMSGVAWTLLALRVSEEAEAVLQLASKSPNLYENADMFYGAAGWGLTNLYFFNCLGREKYLDNAIQSFEHIKQRLQAAEVGYFYENMDDIYCGLAHGSAGIGYFLLRLYLITGREEHLEYARGLLDFDLANTEERSGYLVTRRAAHQPNYYSYWRIGSAGLGSVALRFYGMLSEKRYLEAARKIARYITGKYSVFPTNFSGMVGLGNFLIDMYHQTTEQSYLEESRRFVDRVMLFALEKPMGIAFPGEELLRVSTDYGTGSAGTGTFIQRILTGGGVPYFDF